MAHGVVNKEPQNNPVHRRGLAPSDYHPFPALMQNLGGYKFKAIARREQL
jgi:hypothetical protein